MKAYFHKNSKSIMFAFINETDRAETDAFGLKGLSSDNAFDNIEKTVRSQKQITVSEGVEASYELSLTGG